MSSETKSYFCVAEGCNSDKRKRGRYGYMKDVRFYPFPTQKKAPALRKRWLDLLRRENYEPKRNHRVCSLHFKEGRPTENHPYPELFAYNNFKESLKMRSTTSISKREQCMVKDTQFDISVPPEWIPWLPVKVYTYFNHRLIMIIHCLLLESVEN